MRITVLGRGNLGGGLADLWERAGHQVTRLGRDGGDGIAVTAVAPGLTHTPASVNVPVEEFADTEAHQALRRPLTPDDTAAVVAMLAGDDAAALTGQTLVADGGLVLG